MDKPFKKKFTKKVIMNEILHFKLRFITTNRNIGFNFIFGKWYLHT